MKYVAPWTGNYNSRISQTNNVSTSSGVVGIGVVGIMVIGQSNNASTKDERWINAFYTSMGGKNYAMKRPGFGTNTTPAAGNVGSAVLVWAGSSGGTDVLSAFGATNSTIYNGTSSLGAITGKARSIVETYVGTTATVLIASSDNTGWYYDTSSGLIKIADGDFPGNAGKTTVGDFAFIDGFNCILTQDGLLYVSDSGSATAWTANSFIPVNSYSDKGVGAVRFKTYIMAFKNSSIQFFKNAGLTPCPLVNVDGMTIKVGAISSDAIATIADTVFWCGSTAQGGLSVFQYDGSLNRISPPEIDFQLVLAGPTNISMTTMRFYGRSFVLVKANATTYVYCIEDKRWHEWSTTTPPWYKASGTSQGSQILTYSVSNVSTAGKVFLINPASLVFTDDGVAYTSSIQSLADDVDSPFTKNFEYLAVMADIEPSTSTLDVFYSDDDFVTWITAGSLDLSQPKQYLTGLGGSSRQRAWKVTHASNTAFRISRLLGKVNIGTA